MKKVLSGALAVVVLIFAFNVYKYKISTKPENKEKIVETLKKAGIDEDMVNALDDTIETINTGTLAMDEAKNLLTDTISNDIIDKAENTPAADIKEKEGVSPISEETKELLEQEIKDELITRAEELPTMSEEDINDIVERISSKVATACSEENLKNYLAVNSLEDFNSNITNSVTDDRLGFISTFMKKWLTNMPDINDIDPSQK